MADSIDPRVPPAFNVDSGRRTPRRPEFIKQLGLQLPVSEKDVKQAFYARVKKVHPDHQGNAEQFMQVQQAFDEAIEFAKRSGKRLPWLGTLMPYYIAQRNVANLVREWGGSVQMKQLDWLADTVGVDFAHLADRLTEIDLTGCDIGDEQLEELTADPQGIEFLEVLRLAGTRITDSGATLLTRARQLKEIDVQGTEVSTRMTSRLSQLPNVVNVAGSHRWRQWWHKLTGR